MDSINYLGLGLTGNNQIGSKKKGKNGEINLKDGLTLNELKLIDSDSDGQITLEEFKKAYGGDSSEAKELYKKTLDWLNSKSKKNKDGTTTVTQKNGDITVKSTYDKKGKLIGYSETGYDSTGKKITNKYSVENGKATLIRSKTKNLDGTKETANSDGTVTREGKNTSITTKDGKVTEIEDTNKDGQNEKIKFTYGDDGKIKSIKIKNGNSTIEGEDVEYSEDGTTATIKDKDGNIIATVKTADGKTSVTEYADGKKSKVYTTDKNGYPSSVKEYDENGNLIRLKNAKSGSTREYEYDDNGKLISEVKYGADGKKIYKTEYSTDENNVLENQIKSKTYYDENGKVTKYKEYKYTKNEDGTINRVVKAYSDESKKDKLYTSNATLDADGHTLKKTTKDKDGKVTTKEYEYERDANGKIKEPPQYSKITEKSGNKTTVSTYKDGRVSHKEVTTIKDGVGKTTKYDYEYYPDSGKVKTKVKTNSKGEVTTYKYNPDGSYSKTYKDKNGKEVTEQYDKDGNKIKKPTASDNPTAPEENPTVPEENPTVPEESSTEYNPDKPWENPKDKATRDKEYQEALANATTEKEKAKVTLYHDYVEKKIEIEERMKQDPDNAYKIILEGTALDRQYEEDLKALESQYE